MTAYRIYFLGLICHVGKDTTKTHAALVYDPYHHFAAVATKEHCRPLTLEDVVTFNEANTPFTGDADAKDPVFQKYVMHLQALLGGDLDDDVANRTSAAAIYAPYPKGGKLGVSRYFTYEALHWNQSNRHQRQGCVARLVVLTVNATQLRVLVNSDEVKIGDDYSVLIANVAHGTQEYDELMARCDSSTHVVAAAKNADNAEATDHFNRFGRLVLGETTCTVLQQEPDCDRTTADRPPDWIADLIDDSPAGTNVGCGNTMWP